MAVLVLVVLGVGTIGSAEGADAPASSAATEIGLEVDGKPIHTDVPPQIVSGRTLVPLRVVAEALGAQVDWNGAFQLVTVVGRGQTVALAIGTTEAMVNGVPFALDVPAQIVEGRTMVPLRFIAEALGAAVEWDGDSRVVRLRQEPSEIVAFSWTKQAGRAEIRVAFSEPLFRHEVTALSDPDRVLVTMMPAVIATALPVPPMGDQLLQGLRLIEDGPAVRLEVELTHPVRHRLAFDSDGRGFTLALDYHVIGIVARMSGNVPEVMIRTDGPVLFEKLDLSDPARLVIDVSAGLSPAVPARVDGNLPGAEWLQGVRTGLYRSEPDVTRVVIDLGVAMPYTVEATDFGILVRFPPTVTDVGWEQLADRTRIALTMTALPVFQAVADARGLKLTVTMADTVIATESTQVTGQDAAFAQLNLGPLPGFRNIARVNLSLPYYLGHEVFWQPERSQLIIDLIASPIHGRVIWVDAGHGGTDPGAISAAGNQEKHITLAVARQLEQQLKAAGARVHMTRTMDQSVDLYERPRQANAIGAEIFVSIHVNSAGTATAAGTETYYWRGSAQGLALAEAVHARLVQDLELNDRKVKYQEFVVLRETEMPSILVELAFLSNLNEEKLLLDPTWQAKAAEAVRAGLFDYYWREQAMVQKGS